MDLDKQKSPGSRDDRGDSTAPTGSDEAEALVSRLWDDQADWWIQHVRATPEGDKLRRESLNSALFDLLGTVQGAHILDAGCGEGYLCRLLALKGARVVGIDVSSTLVAAARAVEQADPHGIEYSLGSIVALPPQAKELVFDAIVSNMVLMDIPDVGKAVRGLAQLLAPGGSLVVSVLVGVPGRAGIQHHEQGHPAATALVSRYGGALAWLGEDAPFPTVFFPRPAAIYRSAICDAGLVVDCELAAPLSPQTQRFLQQVTGVCQEAPVRLWKAHRPLR